MKVTSKFRRVESSSERGVTMVLVAVAMVAIIAMAAMSIDLVTLYLAREEAQRAADASALAAARLISVSGVTSAGSGFWSSMCGGLTGWATQAALAVSFQNTVGGQQTNATVTYSDGTTSGATDCSTLGPAFAVNPMVTVQIRPVSIPSFFSRMWGTTSSSVSATATAEVFNPSDSANNGVSFNGFVTPVQPKCVKPWIVPNLDPGTGFQLVITTNGQIRHPGVSTDYTGSSGIVGERLYLVADCAAGGSNCSLTGVDNPPVANSSKVGTALSGPRLDYVPGSVIGPVAAVPSCASAGTNYEKAVAGCDQTTAYQCGLQAAVSGNPNMVDLNENPSGATGDTAMGLACSLTNSATIPLDGQDALISTAYPFVAIAGDANPLNISGSPVVNSNSIMTLPIYDQTAGNLNATGTTNVTVVGFLQVFVNDVAADGSVQVTVLNVAACGSNGSTNTPLTTNSPVPVRLITPPQ